MAAVQRKVGTIFDCAESALRAWGASVRGDGAPGYPSQAPWADMQGRKVQISPMPPDVWRAVETTMCIIKNHEPELWPIAQAHYVKGLSVGVVAGQRFRSVRNAGAESGCGLAQTG